MRESELTGLSSGLVLEKAQVRKKDRRPVHVLSISVMYRYSRVYNLVPENNVFLLFQNNISPSSPSYETPMLTLIPPQLFFFLPFLYIIRGPFYISYSL
jgi:hypothetical protein